MTLILPMMRAAKFSPTDISGILAWFDASNADSITTSGSNIVTWSDLSSSNYLSGAGGTVPTLSVSAQNGLNAVQSGGAGYLSLNTPIPIPSAQTSFLVAKRVTGAFISGLVVGAGTGSDYSIIHWSDTNIYAANTTRNYRSSSGYAPSVFSLYTSQADSASCTMTLNGFSVSNSVASAGSSESWDAIGRYASSNYAVGSVCEHIVYNNVISASDFNNVTGYLRAKWATP